MNTLKPFSRKNNVAICYQISNEYAPYCGVSIASILSHASDDYNYDIIVLCYDLTDKNRRMLYKIVSRSGKGGISLRFLNMSDLLTRWRDKFPVSQFFPPTVVANAYFFCEQIFEDYDKVIRIGADTVLMADIAQLYEKEIGDNYIGGVRDISMPGVINQYDVEQYYERKFGLKKTDIIKSYINADMQIINIKAWKENSILKKLLSAGPDKTNGEWRAVEQDVINRICYGHICYIGFEWNCFPYNKVTESTLDSEDGSAWRKALSSPKLIHYVFGGGLKPWKNPDVECGEIWWSYARQTPFYEELLQKLMQCEANNKIKHVFSEWRKMPSLKRKARLLATLRLFTFGKMRQRIKEKRETIQKRIEAFETATQ